MAYEYFKQFYTSELGYEVEHCEYSYYHNFRLVALAAIDAAQSDRLGFAKQLQEHAHSLLSQTARNMGGADRKLEIRMNRIIHEEEQRRS